MSLSQSPCFLVITTWPWPPQKCPYRVYYEQCTQIYYGNFLVPAIKCKDQAYKKRGFNKYQFAWGLTSFIYLITFSLHIEDQQQLLLQEICLNISYLSLTQKTWEKCLFVIGRLWQEEKKNANSFCPSLRCDLTFTVRPPKHKMHIWDFLIKHMFWKYSRAKRMRKFDGAGALGGQWGVLPAKGTGRVITYWNYLDSSWKSQETRKYKTHKKEPANYQ